MSYLQILVEAALESQVGVWSWTWVSQVVGVHVKKVAVTCRGV